MSRTPRLISIAVLLLGLASCRSTPVVVQMGSPIDRYDHNRSCEVTATAINRGNRTPIDEELYVLCAESVPCDHDDPTCCSTTIAISGSRPAADGWCDAQLMPVFTGVRLPLSEEAGACGRSDRGDLVAYLARGPFARHGVAAGAIEGDRIQAGRDYQPALEVLASEEVLLHDTPELDRLLKARRFKTTTFVDDSRYPLASFTGVVALHHLDFWFVLYRLPSQERFSRLVVVPESADSQDLRTKTPAGRRPR